MTLALLYRMACRISLTDGLLVISYVLHDRPFKRGTVRELGGRVGLANNAEDNR